MVPFGAPANELFTTSSRASVARRPDTFLRLGPRHLSNVNLGANATSLSVNLNLPGIVENILRVLPRTTTIAVVIGNSPLEKFWLTELRQELQPFTNRVQFIWLNELSFESIASA